MQEGTCIICIRAALVEAKKSWRSYSRRLVPMLAYHWLFFSLLDISYLPSVLTIFILLNVVFHLGIIVDIDNVKYEMAAQLTLLEDAHPGNTSATVSQLSSTEENKLTH